MSQNLDKIKEKIRLLLNKAANTPYPHEAQAFQEHAERLMVRHSIESLPDDEKGKEFFTRKFYSRGTYRVAQNSGLLSLMYAFPHLTGFQETKANSRDKCLVVVGTLAELDQFEELVKSLQIQCHAAMLVWNKAYRPGPGERPVTGRRSFVLGFYATVAGRLSKLFREEEATSALVKVNTEAKEWMYKEYNINRKVKVGPKKTSYSGYGAGIEAGKSALIGQGQVGGTKQLS